MSDHTEKTTPVQEQLPTSIFVKIHSVHTSGPLLANASINLNGCFAIRGVKVVQGEHGPFVCMPSYKSGGEYKDVCFPITKDFRDHINTAVVGAYQQELAQLTQRGQEIQGSQAAQEPQEAPFPQQTM
jgi:stage V sporulation protein G